VSRVATYADAVAMVNANQYGNGVAIFTRDGNGGATLLRAKSASG